MKKLFVFIITAFIVIGVAGCKKEEAKPEDLYIKVYDDADGNKHFHPLSIAIAADGEGFITVSSFDSWRIQLMKTDKAGKFEWNYELPSNYVNAVPNLIQRGGENYLICMDAVGLFTYVLKIDEVNHTTTEVASFSNVLYPTYAYHSGTNLYIQNYDRMSYRTGIHRLSADFTSIEESGDVNIFTDVEERIVNHVTFNGNRIPFFVNSTPEGNYIVMNGFYNYSFSLIFLNPDLSFAGVYNGAGFNGGLAAISPSGSSVFSIARFSYDNLYFNPGAQLTPTTIDIAESIPAQGYSELDAGKTVLIKTITAGGTGYKAYLSSTRSNQLLLQLYDNSGTLAGKKYLGKNIPITVSDFVQTSDEGLSILVQAKIMGSLDRIGLVKLSKEQLEEIVQ